MKVTMLLSRFDKTGMTTHTIDLLEALERKGIKTTLIAGYRARANDVADRLYERAVKSGSRIVAVPIPCGNSAWQKVASGIVFVINVLRYRGALHVQSPYLSWIPWLLKKKFVSTLHVNDLIKCFYYKNATQLIAISKETKRYAIDTFGYDESQISIINHGVSSRFSSVITDDERARNRESLGLPIDKILILLVGSIEPRKGHDILLKAVALLPETLKGKIHIVFLGSDKTEGGPNQRWLNGAIKETKTERFVSHFEYADSERFYKICDISILPSWLEGFGLVVIEAMLAGCLCIRTDTEGASEQIIDGKTGFIFPKGNVGKLTEILSQTIENENLRKSIASAGREYAISHFTSDVMADNTVKVYERLLHGIITHSNK